MSIEKLAELYKEIFPSDAPSTKVDFIADDYYVTRGGERAYLACVIDVPNPIGDDWEYPLIGFVDGAGQTEWTAEGGYCNDGLDSGRDLVGLWEGSAAEKELKAIAELGFAGAAEAVVGLDAWLPSRFTVTAVEYEEPALTPTLLLTLIPKAAACECGAAKCKTSHSSWCPVFVAP